MGAQSNIMKEISRIRVLNVRNKELIIAGECTFQTFIPFDRLYAVKHGRQLMQPSCFALY